MKKRYTFVLVFALLLVLAGCGNDKKDGAQGNNNPVVENTDNGTQDTTDETTNTNNMDDNSNQSTDTVNQDEMQKQMDELDYADFELSVEYANQQEYQVELEKNNNNSIEAEIEDDLNKIEIKGADAFNELYPLMKQLTITEQTSKEDAIQEVLATFNLPTDYEEFELDVKFKDGTKLEIEDKK